MEAEGQAEASLHPVSPLTPATLVSFGLMGSRSCWEHCKTAQTLLPIPSSRGAPAVTVCPHGIVCARLSSSLWGWKVPQQPGVLQCRGLSHPALPWEGASMVRA